MFKSLKSFIDWRLGKDIVIEDFANEYGYFVKTSSFHVYPLTYFLKNDPDVRLTLLDQIICLPCQFSLWRKGPAADGIKLEILYQLNSIKLPYRVTLTVDIKEKRPTLPSISTIFPGAKWHQEEIQKEFGLIFEEGERF